MCLEVAGRIIISDICSIVLYRDIYKKENATEKRGYNREERIQQILQQRREDTTDSTTETTKETTTDSTTEKREYNRYYNREERLQKRLQQRNILGIKSERSELYLFGLI